MIHLIAAKTPFPSTASEGAAVSQPRLVRAAHEFEAQMMKELLKPMTGRDALTGEDEDAATDSGSGAALSEFASEALGQALSTHGGFGLANRIVKDLSHSSTGSSPRPVNQNGQGAALIKVHE